MAKAINRLFARFNAALTDRAYFAIGGTIIDATVVPAPKQRDTEEKAAIKEGQIAELDGEDLSDEGPVAVARETTGQRV